MVPVEPTARQHAAARLHSLARRAGDHPWVAIAVIAAFAMTALAVAWDWNWMKAPLERQVQARTGRALEIRGTLDVDLGLTTVVEVGEFRVGNIDWSPRRTMASAQAAEVHIELMPLLRGQVSLPLLRLTGPRLLLEKGPADQPANWSFGDGAAPGSGPQVRHLHIDDGRVRFLSPAGRTDVQAGVNSADSGPAAPISLVGGGQWQANAFGISGQVDSPLHLADEQDPYRIDLRAQAGSTRAHARGTLADPLRLQDFELQVALEGADLQQLHPLLGLALPPTPPYELDGKLSRQGSRWHYDAFEGRVGDSDLGGSASVDTGGVRPYLRAQLASKKLDLDDLSGFLGGAPSSGKGETTNASLAAQQAREEASGRVIPDTPYDLGKLRAMDADVRLIAGRIDAPGWPIEDMDAHLLLEDGVLRLDPLRFGVADGQISADIKMDASRSPISTRVSATARGLTLAKLLPEVELARNAVGKVGGHASLSGAGDSVAAMLGSSNGEVAVAMGPGRISNLLMEFAGLDLGEILKFKLTRDRQIPVRCAFGDFKVADGVMTSRALAFDTTDTILVGSGTINLRDETLDLLIRPRPKDRSLLSLRAPLVVDGTFRDPDIRPDYRRVGLRGVVALALGSIAPPAALLATLELGPGEDSGCGGRYAR